MKYIDFKSCEDNLKSILYQYRNKGIFFRLINTHPNPTLNVVLLVNKFDQEQVQRLTKNIAEVVKPVTSIAGIIIKTTAYCSESFEEKDYLVNYYPYQWDDGLNIPIELKSKLKNGIDVTVVKHGIVMPKKTLNKRI